MGESGSTTIPDDRDDVREALLAWYEQGHREFPWRLTDDPYAILVSEVMSQQTQLERVEKAWAEFLDRWPTVEDLATAELADVVGFWSEHRLGYNNRARYLHEAARQVVDAYGGEFPRTPDELRSLMGVGPYTANAVASFAFNTGDAVVDTNVKRVLYRAFNVPDEDDGYEAVANDLLPPGRSRVWNNAIMELGAVACGSRPRCEEAGCPFRPWCSAYEAGDFTAPDVPVQPTYEGSRRQFRARVVDVLREHGRLDLDGIGHRIRVDYSPEGHHGREWLRGLLSDLESDGLVETDDDGTSTVARLRR